jgi:NDP-sugar pyrophosphorylase family protein
MNIDYAFILAAGLGTRMGELGKVLPKPLWPVFDKSLLELQLEYLKTLGIKKVFINTHHLGHLVQKEIAKLGRSDVVISHEEDIQDIGGGIHRVAEKIGYQGKLLVVNCDQFLWLTPDNVQNMGTLLSEKNPVVLTSIKVNPKMGYNGIRIENNSQFSGLILGDELKQLKTIDTYGGVCLIDLKNLTPKVGKSKFFESIVSLETCRAAVWNASQNEYWDFGTKARFVLSHWELISDYNLQSITGSYGNFLKFLLATSAIDEKKIYENSYGTQTPEMLQFQSLYVKKNDLGEWDVSLYKGTTTCLGHTAP